MGEYGARFLRQLAETTGETVRTVAYMRDESEFGTSVLEAFRAEAQKQGIRIVKDIPYDPFATQDFTTQLAQVEAANPDVLVVTGYYPDGVQIAKNAMSVSPDVKAVYGVANGAFSLESFTKDAGAAGDLYFDSNYHWDGKKDRVKQIRAAFEERTGEAMRTAAVLSYQAVEVIARALEQAGSAEPKAVRDALAKVSVEDPLLTFPGPIKFNERGENVNAQPSLMQVREGEIVQVLPDAFQERKPEFPGVPWSR
jgi:branched-chain amino acid transport system substrate-binding protein